MHLIALELGDLLHWCHDESQQSHAAVKTVAHLLFVSNGLDSWGLGTHLSEVGGALVKVNLSVDLIIAWQWVHENHGWLGGLHQLVVDNNSVLDLLVERGILKALLLDASAVEDIGLGDNLWSEVVGLGQELARSLQHVAKVLWKSELLWRDKLDLDIVVLQKLAEGVDWTTVLEITSKGDGETSDGSSFLANREQVHESLSWVLLAAVSSVNDWNRGVLLGDVDRVSLWVAEDNGVAVACKCSKTILKGLALDGTRGWRRDGDSAATKTLHGGIKRGGSTGACLEEHGAQKTTLKKIKDTLALNSNTHLLGDREEQVEVCTSKLGSRQDVLALEWRASKERLQGWRAAWSGDAGVLAGVKVAGLNLHVVTTSNGLNQDLGVLDIGDKWDLVVDSHAACLVSLRDIGSWTSVAVAGWQVDIQINHVVGQVLSKGVLRLLVLVLSSKDLKVLSLDAVLGEEIGSTGSGEELVAHLLKLANSWEHLHLVLEGTDRKEDVLLWQLEAGGDQCLEVGLVLVATEAGNLTSGGHLNTKNWISASKTGEGELWNLNSDGAWNKSWLGVWLDWNIHDGLGGKLNHVDAHDLGDEWERAGSSDVTLNDLNVVVLGNELDVVWSSDIQGLTNFAGCLLDTLDGGILKILWWQDEGRITGVNTSVLDVLGNKVADHDTILGDGVHLDLLSVLDVLGDNDWVLAGDLSSLLKVCGKILLRVDSVHGSSRENVGWANEDWVGDQVGELPRLLEAGEFLPGWLINTDSVEHAGELVSVLGVVNHLWRGAENLDVEAVERQSDVVWSLSTHGNQNTAGRLKLVDILDGLEVDVLEVEAVSLVIIGGDSLWVVVDHDSLVSVLTESADGADRAPIELDRGTDTVDTRAKNHDPVIIEVNIVLRSVVGHVKVVGESWEFSSDGIDLLDKWSDTSLNSESADLLLSGV